MNLQKRISELKDTLIRKGWEHEHYLSVYYKCSKDNGAILTNKNSQDFSVGCHLYELGFIEKTNHPNITNGSFVGSTITFRSI